MVETIFFPIKFGVSLMVAEYRLRYNVVILYTVNPSKALTGVCRGVLLLGGEISMKHIVFYSGGIGSWMTAKRVIEQHGKENVILLFTDTLIEDHDLYRFIDETIKEMDVEYVYLKDGRTPWEVFKDTRFLGNSRIAKCSHLLKQDIAHKWIVEHFTPDKCRLYLGIDWTEKHRTKAPKENYLPYIVEFPLCEEPYLDKQEMIESLETLGIKQPRLYEKGFAHNNCGGGCVRAGQGHFVHLLRELPEVFAEWEKNEEEMRQFLEKDVSILKRSKTVWKRNRSGGKYKDVEIERLTLKKLREEVEKEDLENIDLLDIGGCGCFVLGGEIN